MVFDGHTKGEVPLGGGASRLADLVMGESEKEFHAGWRSQVVAVAVAR